MKDVSGRVYGYPYAITLYMICWKYLEIHNWGMLVVCFLTLALASLSSFVSFSTTTARACTLHIQRQRFAYLKRIYQHGHYVNVDAGLFLVPTCRTCSQNGSFFVVLGAQHGMYVTESSIRRRAAHHGAYTGVTSSRV